ncbi:MAG: 5-amino-6-(D-ribitylamino)uracil--L-tyrosine 4-hydroxyphenyl transferase CofH [Myxococcales bacterium]|nr:5-amino-6-(D-ribitylamino)uracil--L-tyrosine 4-hydroxyphenyl transferase CofH [Myxococcales bacterium]
MQAPHMNLADPILRGTGTPVRDVLERALEGRELTRADAVVLLGAQGRDLQVLCSIADLARAEDVGDEVSYVVNRNINFTNICYVGCSFCGFARHKHDEDAYDRGLDDIVARAREAWDLGASEVCIQGGIHPNKDGFWYREIIEAIKTELPDMHIHAFSPEEIHFGVEKSGGMSLHAYLKMLREAGLGTIPGTAAEILDDEIRRKLSPRKLMSGRWLEIVRAAHEVGLRSSSTLMYGHIESVEHIARHLELLRDLQKQTGGFTEFVPLGFIHHQTRLYLEQGSRPGASMPEDLRLVAVARLFLRPWIQNVQVSWVKMGWKMAQMGLLSGANDFGGTLMEESISQAAGSEHGDHIEAHEIEQLVREIGRPSYERTTTYGRREPRSDAGTRPELAPSATPPIGFALGSGY